METTKRSNIGYDIIEAYRCNDTECEVVIGYNPSAAMPYVCWFCLNGNDYYWGCYYATLHEALHKLDERMLQYAGQA